MLLFVYHFLHIHLKYNLHESHFVLFWPDDEFLELDFNKQSICIYLYIN